MSVLDKICHKAFFILFIHMCLDWECGDLKSNKLIAYYNFRKRLRNSFIFVCLWYLSCPFPSLNKDQVLKSVRSTWSESTLENYLEWCHVGDWHTGFNTFFSLALKQAIISSVEVSCNSWLVFKDCIDEIYVFVNRRITLTLAKCLYSEETHGNGNQISE